MQLGDFDVQILSDGSFVLDGGQMFGVVPKVLWEKKMPADERNRIRLGLTCVLVRTGRENVVIETGIGDKFDAKFADIYGINPVQRLSEEARLKCADMYAVEPVRRLPEELRDLGVPMDSVDIVINSHLHFDHCGWNTRREDGRTVPTFPRARYFIQRGEWEHALAPTERDRASYVEEFFRAAEGQTVFLDGDQQIVPGIRVQVLPGHNRNMQAVWIESRGERACFISDLVPTSAHVPYPWIMAFDLYPMETLANKRRLLPELLRDQVLVIFPHDPSMPCVRLVEHEGKIMAVPVEVSPLPGP
jgi:glyoxylase-like metal-dependent hydrolase (beta-lactamase superfamily II)